MREMGEMKKKEIFINQIYFFIDILLTVLAFSIARIIKIEFLPTDYRGLSNSPNYLVLLLLIIIIWAFNFYFFNFYQVNRGRSFGEIIRQSVKALVTGMFILLALIFMMKITGISRILLGLFMIMNLILLLAMKYLLYRLEVYEKRKSKNAQYILIIGTRLRARQLIGNIMRVSSGHTIIGCLDIDDAAIGKEVRDGVRIIGTMNDLKSILMNRVVDEVIFAMPLTAIVNADKHMLTIEEIGIRVRILPDWHVHALIGEPKIASMLLDEFYGMPTLVLTSTSPRQLDLLLKQVIDKVLAGLALIALAPLFFGIIIAIRIASRGPVLFKQERIGLNGRHFTLYKFRTMVVDAEAMLAQLSRFNEADGPAFKIRNDPRIIPLVGTLLRKTSLDELPQLFNVLKGEMSLVGPRPPLPSEVLQYDTWQRRRLSMKPGLTCLWQIAPQRNDLSFEQWMKLDLHYIDRWSLMLDLRILVQTAAAVLSGYGR